MRLVGTRPGSRPVAAAGCTAELRPGGLPDRGRPPGQTHSGLSGLVRIVVRMRRAASGSGSREAVSTCIRTRSVGSGPHGRGPVCRGPRRVTTPGGDRSRQGRGALHDRIRGAASADGMAAVRETFACAGSATPGDRNASAAALDSEGLETRALLSTRPPPPLRSLSASTPLPTQAPASTASRSRRSTS